MARIDIRGDIVENSYARFYKWFGWECVTPGIVSDVIAAAAPDEPLDVYINSGGGLVSAGQEIYSTLVSHKDRVMIHIESMAASAASIIAMAGRSEISPVGILMIHNVSGGAHGDYHAMEKEAEILKQYNAALCAAYCAKTKKRLDTMLKMMDEETWLTAAQAVHMGFVDKLMDTATDGRPYTAGAYGIRLTPELMAEAEAAMAAAGKRKDRIISDLDLFGI